MQRTTIQALCVEFVFFRRETYNWNCLQAKIAPSRRRRGQRPPFLSRGGELRSPNPSQRFLVVHLWSPDPRLDPLLAVDQITVDKGNRVAVPVQGVWTFLRPHRGRLTLGRPFKAGIADKNVRPSRSDDLVRDQTSRPQARSPRKNQSFFWLQATIGNQYEQA